MAAKATSGSSFESWHSCRASAYMGRRLPPRGGRIRWLYETSSTTAKARVGDWVDVGGIGRLQASGAAMADHRNGKASASGGR